MDGWQYSCLLRHVQLCTIAQNMGKHADTNVRIEEKQRNTAPQVHIHKAA